MNKQVCLDLLGSAQYGDHAVKLLNDLALEFPNVDFIVGIIVKAAGWESGTVTARKLAPLDNVVGIRLHGLWLDSHGFEESHIEEILPAARNTVLLAEKHPDKKFYFSPFLEHKMRTELLNKVYSQVQGILEDKVTYVNSAMPGGAKLSSKQKGLEEIHHELDKPTRDYIFSFDGVDQNDADITKYKLKHPSASMFFSWVFPYNLKYTGKDTTIRLHRKLFPPLKLVVNSVYQFITDEGETRLPQDRIYKAVGEPGFEKDHSKPISRSWQMVYISPYSGGKVEFKQRGKVVATFNKTTGVYDGRNIFRCASWGLDVWKALPKNNKLVNVWEGENRVGIVNPIFRVNNFSS